MTTALWILLGLLGCFLLVITARALAFRPAPPLVPDAKPMDVDTDAAAAHLQAMLRVKTVSDIDDAR